MPRHLVSKTSFLGGEAGYLLEGRSDLAQYQLGAGKIENFLVMKGGGITRRPPTRYVKNTQGNLTAKLIPFVISYDSGTDIYVVEICAATSVTATVRVIRVSDNSVITPTNVVDSLTMPTGTADGTFALATGYDLNEVQYAQVGGALFLVSKYFQPLILVRTTTAPAFSLSTYINYVTDSREIANSVPHRDENVSATTIAPSATTGTWTGAGTGVQLTASTAIFSALHVNAYFLAKTSGTWGAIQIREFIDSTHVRGTVTDAFGGTGATAEWIESSWSQFRGWPRTITVYNQRLIFGGNTDQPDTFWTSVTDNYFKVADPPDATVTADSAQQFQLASGKLNQIRWMVGGKKLSIGTSSSEWVGEFFESSDGTSTQVQFNEETTHGSAKVMAYRNAYTIPFVQRSGKTIREMVFDFYSNSYACADLSLFGSHIGTAYGDYASATGAVGIVAIEQQESPFNILWALDNQGRLYGLTRDKEQQIYAWHSHKLGGATGTSPILPAKVISMCSVPDGNGALDRLWLVVNRTINGVNQYHVEFMDDIHNHPVIISPGVLPFLDCQSTHTNGSNTVSWTGFTRFASSTANVVAMNSDGSIVYSGPVAVDSSGNATLPYAANAVIIGLHANAELRLLPFEGGDAPPMYMLGVKRADKVSLRLHETFGLRTGVNRVATKTGWSENATFSPIPFDNSSSEILSAYTFTGVMSLTAESNADADGSLAFAMHEPWPCTILSICSRVVTNEV